MAVPRLVLAELTIDSSGVVTGMADVQESFAQGEQNVDQFSERNKKAVGVTQQFVNKLFNLRGAINVVARAFGIVGVVVALSVALRKLIVDVVSNTEAWKKLKSSLEDAYNSFIKGETLVGRVSRKIAEAAKEAGASTITSTINQIQKVSQFIDALKKELQGVAPGDVLRLQIEIDLENANRQLEQLFNQLEDLGFSRGAIVGFGATSQNTLFDRVVASLLSSGGIGGAAGAAFLGARAEPGPSAITTPAPTGTPSPALLDLAGLKTLPERSRELNRIAEAVTLLNAEFAQTGNIKRYMAGFEALQKAMVSLHATTEEFARAGVAAPGPDIFAIMGIPSQQQIEERVKGIKAALAVIRFELDSGLSTVPIQFVDDAILKLRDSLEELKLPASEMKAIFEEFHFTLTQGVEKHIPEFIKGLQEIADNITLASGFMEIFLFVIQTAANALADAFLEGGVNFRKVVVDMLKGIARIAISWGLLFLALGIVASTPWGQILGPPAKFFKASAVMFGVAAVSGAAAKALSKEGGGGREPGAAGGLGSGTPQRQATVVNVNIEGSLLGSDPNELARSISDLITTAQQDGAR